MDRKQRLVFAKLKVTLALNLAEKPRWEPTFSSEALASLATRTSCRCISAASAGELTTRMQQLQQLQQLLQLQKQQQQFSCGLSLHHD